MTRRKKFIIAFLVVSASAFAWVYFTMLQVGPAMHRREAQERITAENLYNLFDQDEALANQRFLNQILEIEGVVISVEISDKGKPVVNLETNGFGVVNCTLEDSDFNNEGLEAYLGQAIVLKGECIGLLLDVLIIEAIVIE